MTKIKKRPTVRARKAAPDIMKHTDTSLRYFKVAEGLPTVPEMQIEIQDMMDVLLGREESPVGTGINALMECADMYFARASELTTLILAAEREGAISTTSQTSKFRKGELRTFMEMAKRASDLGSRRITVEQLKFEMETFGRETKGGVPR